MGSSVSATAAVIATMNAQIVELAKELDAHFEQHPDAEVVRSLPGLGTILSARVLGEFGDEPNRYATAKSRKNYAGTSPITRASGTKRIVLARFARNMRLADAIYLWAFASLSASPGLGPSTTTAEPPETPITQRCATSEIASSASCTVASFATPTTTRTLPGDTGQNSNWPEPLDKLGPWDI
jgi:hypothetical protein